MDGDENKCLIIFKVWNLHIRNIEEGDRGCYMCQINTEHMRQEIGCIDVNVPPDIDMSKTSSDNAVQVIKPTLDGSSYPL